MFFLILFTISISYLKCSEQPTKEDLLKQLEAIHASTIENIRNLQDETGTTIPTTAIRILQQTSTLFPKIHSQTYQQQNVCQQELMKKREENGSRTLDNGTQPQGEDHERTNILRRITRANILYEQLQALAKINTSIIQLMNQFSTEVALLNEK